MGKLICNGTLKHHQIDCSNDFRDVYYCDKCGMEGRFDFDLKCERIVEKSNAEVVYDVILNYQKLGYDNDYILVAIKDKLKKIIENEKIT